jgi:hypothetical protein
MTLLPTVCYVESGAQANTQIQTSKLAGSDFYLISIYQTAFQNYGKKNQIWLVEQMMLF